MIVITSCVPSFEALEWTGNIILVPSAILAARKMLIAGCWSSDEKLDIYEDVESMFIL